MSGELSTTFEMASVELISEQRTYNSRSISGKRFARLGEYQLWRIRCTFNVLSRAELGPLMGFLMRQRGKYETFTIKPKGYDNPLGNWGTITVSSVTNDNTIVMAGFSNSDNDAVKAGDVFTIEGDTKVYMVTDNAASDGSGNCTVTFEPALVVTPSGGEAVTHTAVSFTVELDDSNISYKRGGLLYDGFQIDLIEALS